LGHAETIARVRCALRSLHERDRWILDVRYALDGGTPPPLRVLGGMLGMTREGARLAERRALLRLRAGGPHRRRDHRGGGAAAALQVVSPGLRRGSKTTPAAARDWRAPAIASR